MWMTQKRIPRPLLLQCPRPEPATKYHLELDLRRFEPLDRFGESYAIPTKRVLNIDRCLTTMMNRRLAAFVAWRKRTLILPRTREQQGSAKAETLPVVLKNGISGGRRSTDCGA